MCKRLVQLSFSLSSLFFTRSILCIFPYFFPFLVDLVIFVRISMQQVITWPWSYAFFAVTHRVLLLLSNSSLADLASSLLMFDAQGLVPCLLQQVIPLIMNHEEADTILEDPKVTLHDITLVLNSFASTYCLLMLLFPFIDCYSWNSLMT